MDDWSPCWFVEHDNGMYNVCFDDFGHEEFMVSRGLEGGGYTWQAIVDSLVRRRYPELAELIKYDPEGSMFAAYGSDPKALKVVAALIRQAQTDEALLVEAVEHADPGLLE